MTDQPNTLQPPMSALRPSFVVRAHVERLCVKLGWVVSTGETTTGSPQLQVRLPGGVVNVVFTMARRS